MKEESHEPPTAAATLKEELDAFRLTSRRTYDRSENALQQALQSSVPVPTIQRRYADLKKRWDNVQQAHDTYIIKCCGKYSSEQITKEDEWINNIANQFYKLEIETDSLIESRQPRISANESIQQTAAKHNNNFIQLEPLKFSSFDGSVRKYPKFRFEFKNYIEPMCNVSQLPIVLKSYLSSTVREDIEHVDNDIDSMWARLDQKYGDRQKLIDDILLDISSLEANNNTEEAALEMINTIERAHHDLVRMKEESELNNSTMLSKIEKQMPDSMYGEWIKKVVTLPIHQKFKELLPFLKEWRVRIEYSTSAVRSANRAVQAHQHYKNTCWIHKNAEHPIWTCRVFQAIPVAERKELTESNQACTSCLETGHVSNNCRRSFKCPHDNCSETHNQLLHQ
jgi:hypothetical protein